MAVLPLLTDTLWPGGMGVEGQAGADSGAISQHRETMSQKGHLLSEVRGDFLEAGDAS